MVSWVSTVLGRPAFEPQLRQYHLLMPRVPLWSGVRRDRSLREGDPRSESHWLVSVWSKDPLITGYSTLEVRRNSEVTPWYYSYTFTSQPLQKLIILILRACGRVMRVRRTSLMVYMSPGPSSNSSLNFTLHFPIDVRYFILTSREDVVPILCPK